MKKLKLNLQNIEGVELLTREQLKMVMGGSEEGGGKCKAGPCSLSVQGSDGKWVTREGTCSGGERVTPGSAWDVFFPSYTDCYCDAGMGDDVPLSSNGGVSRCTA